MKAIIMAAGKSTRTYPLTLTKPKPLLKVANKPILAHQLDMLEGIADTAVVVIGYKGEMIREAFGEAYNGLRIQYVEQETQLGTGHAILECAPLIDGPFLAMNGDDLYDRKDFQALAASPGDAALAKTVEDPRLYGIYEVDKDGRVIRIVEKPVDVFSNLANIGAYRFDPAVFDVIRATKPSERGEIEITSALQTLAECGEVHVVKSVGVWIPIGYPWHLLDANEYILSHQLDPVIVGEVSPAAHIDGPVAVGRGTVIRPGAVINGPVSIGSDCVIGPNCWLRPGTTVGNGCRVGHAVELKNSILFDGAYVCHLSYIGDSIVGERANLGCGTVTANVRHDGGDIQSVVNGKLISARRTKLGAVFADNVHTGIHTAVYPGRKIWPGATTRPGEVVQKDIVL